MQWDEHFMSIALIVAMKSKDPSTQVGAVIVSPHKVVVSTGYNGAPRGVDDDLVTKQQGTAKYAIVAHAELNAIIQAQRDLNGYMMYCNVFPCNECMKTIIQSGIKEVYYLHMPSSQGWQEAIKFATLMAEQAGVKLFSRENWFINSIVNVLDAQVRVRK